MAAIPKRLRDLLDHYRLRWRVVQATMGLLMMFCAILGGAGLGVLVDRLLLGAPRGLRWVLLVAIALAAAALLVRRVLAPVSKRMGDERTAARLGRNFPNMAEDLVTGVELSRDQDSYGVSKGLVDVALNQIDQRSQTVSWRAGRAARQARARRRALRRPRPGDGDGLSLRAGGRLQQRRAPAPAEPRRLLLLHQAERRAGRSGDPQGRRDAGPVHGLRPRRDARGGGSPPDRRVVRRRGQGGRRRRRLAERPAPRRPALSRQGRRQRLALVRRPHAAVAGAHRESPSS